MNVTWSHSGLKDFTNCARKYHEIKVLKNYPRQETAQTIYGTEMHEACELYVRDGKPLEQRFTFLKPMLDKLLEKPGRKLCEYEMALTKDLQPSGFKDDPTTWVRGIADLLIIDDDNFSARCVDYKSGSDKYPDRDQLVLMALMVFAHFPHIREVKGMLAFCLKGTAATNKVTRDEAEAHWWKYREKVARIEQAHASGVWNPTQSGLCKKHCEILWCEMNGRR